MKSSIILILSWLSFIGCQRIVNFKSSGVYFKYLGDVKVKNDQFIISTFIDLSGFHNASSIIEKTVADYRGKCLDTDKITNTKLNCSADSNLDKVERMSKEIVTNLDYLYQTLGKKINDPKRRRRDVGLGLAIDNYASIGKISIAVDEMRSDFNKSLNNLDIVKNELSTQDQINKILREQIEGSANRTNIHKNKLNLATEKITNLENIVHTLYQDVKDLDLEARFHDLRISVVEIYDKLNEIKQAVMDLKVNLLHSSIMSKEELTRRMQAHKTNENFLAPPQFKNYPIIAETIDLSALLQMDEKLIMIFIEIPLYSKNHQLYEVISLPIIKENRILYVPNDDKYCVITENKREYYCTSKYDYKKINDFYVCDDDKKLSFLPTLKRNKCIINIMRGRSFDNCNGITKIPQNIEIFKKLEPNTYLFALRDPTTYKFECSNSTHSWNNFHRNDSLSGTGTLFLGTGCEFYTDETEVKSEPFKADARRQEHDIFLFGLDRKVNSLFNNFNFTDFPEEKIVMNFDQLKDLLNEDYDVENEINNDSYE